jgi:hypothetical protein
MIVAVVVLIALGIWWVVYDRGDGAAAIGAAENDTVSLMSAGEADTGMPMGAEVFLRWSDERRTPGALNPDHSHTGTGIRNLAAALDGLAEWAHVDARTEVATVQRLADTLWANTASARHADVTRRAFVTLSELMGRVQHQLAPGLTRDVAEVRRAAESIRPGDRLLEQRDRVQEFFERSATVVRQMSRSDVR